MINTYRNHLHLSLFGIKQYLSVLILILITFNFCYAGNNELVLLGDQSNKDGIKKGAISYFFWLDLDANSKYDIGEEILKNYTIRLYHSEKDSLIKEVFIIDEGRFYFKDLPKDKYYIKLVFEANDRNNFLRPLAESQYLKATDDFSFESIVFDLDPENAKRINLDFAFRNQEVFFKANEVTMCTDYIDTSYIEVTIENCENLMTFCIDESIADMLSYTITDNGQAYIAGISPCDFDTSFAYTYSALPDAGILGPYFLDNWTVDGNNFSGAIATMADLTDSMNIWDIEGNWIHDNLTASIRGGNTTVNYSDMDITQTATSSTGVLFLSTNLNPNGSELTLDTGFHQLIFMEPIDGCLDTLEVQVNCIPCLDMYNDGTVFELDNCNDSQAICFDISAIDLASYELSSNGLIYNDPINACSSDSFFRYDYSGFPGGGSVGPYLLQNWSINGSLFLTGFNSIGDLVDSMNIWDSGANWEISDPLQTITGGNPLNSYGAIEVLQLSSNISAIAPVEQAASITSIQITLDTGMHEVVFYNPTNQCIDSFDLEVNCTPCPELLGGGMINLIAEHCDSMTAVCLPIPFLEISDYSTFINDNLYTGSFEICDVANSGIRLDTGSYRILMVHSITGCQDSIDIEIACVPPVVCTDFINETFVALAINDCASTTDLCIEIPFNEIPNYSISVNDSPFTGSLNDCNGATGVSLNSGTYEVVISLDSTGCSDTIITLVTCLLTEVIDVSVLVNNSDSICLDILELPGAIVSINNFCENSSGEFSLIEINSDTYCIYYEGIEEGMEQVCIEICDSLGFCDSTYINIKIEPLIIVEPDLPPNAVDDFIQIAQGSSIFIDVLDNDEINGSINAFGILNNPANGEAILRADNTIEYIPDPEYCRSTMPDSIVYTLCNEIDCDEAVVYIDVECNNILVHNGFSPNGDGRNDYFIIKGAASNPDNTLSVFNRWGGRVYQIENYQNNWNGTWQGEDLPDGTYFYYYKDGNGQSATGHLVLQR